MQSVATSRILTGATVALLSLTGAGFAQQQAREAPARTEPAPPPKDYNQRALGIYEFRKATQSGPARGQEIYYYKCWMCHNEFAQSGGPNLAALFTRATLVNGEALSEASVKKQIKNGSANMPAYGHVLDDTDLSDLVAWLKDEKCCWDNDA